MEKSFWQYWKNVHQQASKEASKKIGFGWRILGVVVSAVAGIVASILLGGYMLISVVGGVLGVFFWLLILFIIYSGQFIGKPVLLYNTQATEIQSYKEKWGLNKVKTNEIYLYPSEESIDHRAVLSIKNKESVDLNRCYGHAIKVMVGSEEHWENRTHTANSGGELLTWFIHGDAVEWTIKRDTSELLCVAYRHDNGSIGFTHHGRANTVNKDNPKASIYIEIQIDGYMNEKPIEPIYFKGFIRQNDNDIYLEEGESL
jgi:hypothetical protein